MINPPDSFAGCAQVFVLIPAAALISAVKQKVKLMSHTCIFTFGRKHGKHGPAVCPVLWTPNTGKEYKPQELLVVFPVNLIFVFWGADS